MVTFFPSEREALKLLDAKIFNSVLDSTYLKQQGEKKDKEIIEDLINNAYYSGNASVCIRPEYVVWAKKNYFDWMEKEVQIVGCRPKLSTVIDFHYGDSSLEKKIGEITHCFEIGAEEVEPVSNYRYLLSDKKGDENKYIDEIEGLVRLVAKYNEDTKQDKVLKIILEQCYLANDQISSASYWIANYARANGVHTFVKSSTGFGEPEEGIFKGATTEGVRVMKNATGEYSKKFNRVGVKPASLRKGKNDKEALGHALRFMIDGGCFDERGLRPKIKKNLPDMFRIGTSIADRLHHAFKAYHKEYAF